MTMPGHIKNKCAVCGAVSSQTIILSTNSIGSPDLDLRPPEMRRSTMRWWIQECPECGYVAKDISTPCLIGKALLNQDGYKNCDGLQFGSKLAENFYKLYFYYKLTGFYREASSAVLHAAWACDDINETENAIICRKKAEIMLTKSADGNELDETTLVLRADLLRRSEQFDKLIADYENRSFSEDILQKIIAFQLEKARARDTACYTVAQAIEEPM